MPVDPTACCQHTSQHTAVVNSICSRPPSNDMASTSHLLTESSSTTPADSNATCDPWEQEQLNELLKCVEFERLTCGCSKANGKPCSGLLSEEHYA